MKNIHGNVSKSQIQTMMNAPSCPVNRMLTALRIATTMLVNGAFRQSLLFNPPVVWINIFNLVLI